MFFVKGGCINFHFFMLIMPPSKGEGLYADGLTAFIPSFVLTAIMPSCCRTAARRRTKFPVARALLPAEADEGVRLRYSMLEYTVCG